VRVRVGVCMRVRFGGWVCAHACVSGVMVCVSVFVCVGQ
jgi:hypothetical protein